MKPHPSKILIVDDDDQNMLFVQTVLREGGYITCAAHDGFEGLDLLEKFAPDLVLLDWLMPRLGGSSVCRQLRQHRQGSRPVPIMVMTGLADPADRQAALATGADGFLTKPVSVRDLLAQVQALLSCEDGPG